MTARAAAACSIIVALLLGGVFAARADATSRARRRLLVFSMPDVTWSEFRNADAPTLRAFFATSDVANLAPARTVSHKASPADAYLTYGAGTRAVGHPEADGAVVATTPGGPLTARGWSVIEHDNRRLPYDTKVGAVVRELQRHGVHVAAIANADGNDGPGPMVPHREAALAAASPAGQVQSGAVGADLLEPDPAAPFGVRTNIATAERDFVQEWSTPGAPARVVIVEASDLARAQRYRSLATPAQAAALRAAALRNADALFARLIAHVDLTHDAVMVLGSPSSTSARTLDVAALHEPGKGPGYLKSASTQHAGVVMTIDVGPAMLDLFGIDFTAQMEGRPFEVVGSHSSLAAKEKLMVDEARGSVLRNDRLVPVTMLLVALFGIVAFATLMAVAYPEQVSARRRRIVAWTALFALATMPASLLVDVLPGNLASFGVYLALVAVVAALLATAAWFVPRRPYGPLVAMLAVVAGVVTLDAITGSHLQYNAVFGYAPTSNSRLYGISNYTFGAMLVAALFLAGFAVAFLRGRTGQIVALGVLLFVLVVDGLPVWGADVGGVLAAVPTFLVFVAWLRRGRLRVRTVLLAIGATAVAIGAFAAIDLARPADQRAHLGRLVERVGASGAAPLTSVVHRKLVAALNESVHSFWLLAIPIGIVVIVLLGRLGDRPLARVRAQVPTLGVVLVSAYVGAVLGSALNDSGAIVGGIVMFTLATACCYLSLEPSERREADIARSSERGPGGPAPTAPRAESVSA